jgi:hypothetical protein
MARDHADREPRPVSRVVTGRRPGVAPGPPTNVDGPAETSSVPE